MDFKSANKPKREDYIESYFLQVGAYSLAHNEVYKSDIDQGVILICTVDGLYQDFKIAGNLLKSYQQKFLQRVDKFTTSASKIIFRWFFHKINIDNISDPFY